MIDHAGQFDDSSQLHLAPRTPHMGGLQRSFQVSRGCGQGLKLFSHLRLRAGALRLDFLQLGVDLTQRLLERFDEPIDGALTMVQINRGLLLEFAERRLRELKERLVVRPQRIGRHGCERFAQCVLCLLEQPDPVGPQAALPVQLGGRADQPLGLFAGVRACRRRLRLRSGRALAQSTQPQPARPPTARPRATPTSIETVSTGFAYLGRGV